MNFWDLFATWFMTTKVFWVLVVIIILGALFMNFGWIFVVIAISLIFDLILITYRSDKLPTPLPAKGTAEYKELRDRSRYIGTLLCVLSLLAFPAADLLAHWRCSEYDHAAMVVSIYGGIHTLVLLTSYVIMNGLRPRYASFYAAMTVLFLGAAVQNSFAISLLLPHLYDKGDATFLIQIAGWIVPFFLAIDSFAHCFGRRIDFGNQNGPFEKINDKGLIRDSENCFVAVLFALLGILFVAIYYHLMIKYGLYDKWFY